MPECVTDHGSIANQFDYGVNQDSFECKFQCEKDGTLNDEVALLSREFTAMISTRSKTGISKSYDEAVNVLGFPSDHPKSLTKRQVCLWLLAFSEIISNLNHTVIELVISLLRFDWISRDEDVYKVYNFFLGNLMSAHPTYSGAAIQILISKLADITELEGNHYKLSRIHNLLRQILDLVPSSLTFILSTVNETYPKKHLPVDVQVAYLRSVFEIAEYAPALREKLFGVVIDKFVRIDLDIQVEIETLDENDKSRDNEFCRPTPRDENSIPVDDVTVDSNSDSTDNESLNLSQNKLDLSSLSVNVKETVEKLDAMLSIIFHYLQKIFMESPKSVRDSFFSSSLKIFAHLILPTYNPRYVQFMWFYMCRFDYTYYELFIGMLLTKIFSKHEPEIIRITASSYLGSFIARCKYLSTYSVRMCLRLLNNWCYSYVSEYSPPVNGDTAKKRASHILFYSVVQTSMYIFCFWWNRLLDYSNMEKDLISPDDNNHYEHEDCAGYSNEGATCKSSDLYLAEFQQMSEQTTLPETLVLGKFPPELDGFQNIITSTLYPLSVCSTSISYEFARITYKCSIFYCYPLINNDMSPLASLGEGIGSIDNSLPQESASSLVENQTSKTPDPSSHRYASLVGPTNRLELHFPFDNISDLTNSASFISDIFRKWDNIEPDQSPSEF